MENRKNPFAFSNKKSSCDIYRELLANPPTILKTEEKCDTNYDIALSIAFRNPMYRRHCRVVSVSDIDQDKLEQAKNACDQENKKIKFT